MRSLAATRSECSNAAADPNTALFSIDVIQVPVDRPQEARVVSRPRIFADPATGAIVSLHSGKLQLLRDDGDTYTLLAEAKTR